MKEKRGERGLNVSPVFHNLHVMIDRPQLFRLFRDCLLSRYWESASWQSGAATKSGRDI